MALAAVVAVGLLLNGGCVSYDTFDETKTLESQVTATKPTALTATRVAAPPRALRLELKRSEERTLRVVTQDVRTSRVTFDGLVETIDGDDPFEIILAPVALAIDGACFIITAPFMIPAAYIAEGEQDPVTAAKAEKAVEPVPSGSRVSITWPGRIEAPLEVPVGDGGVIELDAYKLADQALLGGTGDLQMRIVEPDWSELAASFVFNLSEQLDVVASGLSALEARIELWTSYERACPDSAPTVRAAIINRLQRDREALAARNRIASGQVAAAAPKPAAPPAPKPTQPAAPPARPVAAPAPPAALPGRTFVLVVGINRYADEKISALRFAESDARSVYGFFATSRRSPTDSDRVRLLLGADATRMNILRAIREHLIERATRPDDMAVLFFAGHGFADPRQSYLATTDTVLDALPETAISRATLDEFWGQVVAQRVLMVDACHAGGLEGIRGIGGVRAATAPGAAGSERPGMSILASGPNEVSVEDERTGNGVFTRALLNALSGDADLDRNGFVTGEEMTRYLREEVPALARQVGGRQTPVIDAVAPARMRLTR